MSEVHDVIANRYRLLEPLGSGSYATTYLAVDQLLQRYVAVKVLRPEHSSDQQDLESLKQEARNAARVSHPNIVLVYDAGTSEDVAYLVMEWIDGTTLKSLIQSRRRIGLKRAIEIVDDLLAGLGAIHSAGIVHRDIKPQNVLVTTDGLTKLTDFGVAGSTQDIEDENGDFTMGTAAYMAPEQACNSDVTPAADIYSVGVILFEMLTGRLPFASDDPVEVIHQHVNEPAPRPRRINPNIPPAIEQVVLTALAKNPADRFATTDDMRAALVDAQQEAATRRVHAMRSVSTPAGVAQGFSLTRRQRVPVITIAVVAAFVIIAGTAAFATRDLTPLLNRTSDDLQTVSVEPIEEIPLFEFDAIREGAEPEPDEEELPTMIPTPQDSNDEDQPPVDRPAPQRNEATAPEQDEPAVEEAGESEPAEEPVMPDPTPIPEQPVEPERDEQEPAEPNEPEVAEDPEIVEEPEVSEEAAEDQQDPVEEPAEEDVDEQPVLDLDGDELPVVAVDDDGDGSTVTFTVNIPGQGEQTVTVNVGRGSGASEFSVEDFIDEVDDVEEDAVPDWAQNSGQQPSEVPPIPDADAISDHVEQILSNRANGRTGQGGGNGWSFGD